MMFDWGDQRKGFWPLNLFHLLLLQFGQSTFSVFLHAFMIWVGNQSQFDELFETHCQSLTFVVCNPPRKHQLLTKPRPTPQ
ncbi:MAG: hypothetical protein IPO72_19930 [Saprospiraceae bacterium]|nr:hypothetical protein [Candidatus Vicinibacter affinis]